MAQSTAKPAASGGTSARPPWQLAAERVRHDTPGLDWLAERRAAALARVDQAGLPDSSQEDWRYTSLAAYEQRWTDYLAVDDQPAGSGGRDSRLPSGPTSGPAVAVELQDGVLRDSPARTPAGLTVVSLRKTNPGLRARAEALLGRVDGPPGDGLVDLNTTLLDDVILIATEPGSCLAEPVYVRLRGSGRPAFSQPRLLVDAGSGSSLTLILEHTGLEGTLVNAVNQIWLGSGSQLTLIRVQDLPDDGMLTETTRVELAGSASLQVTSVDLGGQLCRQAITVLLAGAGAAASVDGMFLADGQRHIDNCTRLEHQAPRTTSRETFRGIADDHGHGVFNGKIIVQPGAAGSNASLTNRNLLLKTTAEIDTKPELEIYVDDVRCSHGATTGQLDANALFYLRSRGLDPAAARQVLTAAFLRESLASIALPELRARLEARLQARLGGDLAIAGPGAGSA